MFRTVLGAASFVALVPFAAGSVLAASPECARTLSLADVLDRVRTSPRMAAALEENEAQRDLARQAGARPNPELRVELEDFTGSGEFSEFGQSQTTLSLAQRIELGGVRERRVESATREGEAVAARGRGEQAQAEANAKQRYVELVASAEALEIALDAERLAGSFLADAERRAAAAAATEADAARARVAISAAALDAAGRRRDLTIAAQRLVALWGGAPDEAVCFLGPKGGRSALPAVPLRGPSVDATRSPAVALAEAEVESSRADAALARASAAPDLEIGAGLRHLAGPDDVSAVAELRVEVPIFDRNEGAISAAERRLAAAQHRASAVRGETEARVARLEATLAAASERSRTISSTMIPAAENAAATLARAWQAGAVSGQEVLAARKTLVELRVERLEAASEYWRTVAALEAATGTVTPALAAVPQTKED